MCRQMNKSPLEDAVKKLFSISTYAKMGYDLEINGDEAIIYDGIKSLEKMSVFKMGLYLKRTGGIR